MRRNGCFTLRLHLIMQAVDNIPDGHLPHPDAGPFAGRGAGEAGIFRSQPLGGALLVLKPDAPQQSGGVHFIAGGITGCALAQRAVDHICSANIRFNGNHAFTPRFEWGTGFSRRVTAPCTAPASAGFSRRARSGFARYCLCSPYRSGPRCKDPCSRSNTRGAP